MSGSIMNADELQEFYESHPQVEEQMERASKAYKIFENYLALTANRIVIRESGGSTAEVDLNGTLSRTDF